MSDDERENGKDVFGRFLNSVIGRLKTGATIYGNRSFSADPLELLRELQEETLDIAGWGFILWHRLERMKSAIEKTEVQNGK